MLFRSQDILDIAFHLVRYGNGEEIQRNALSLISLSMDTDWFNESASFQLSVFQQLKTLSDQSQKDTRDIALDAQFELPKLLFSSIDKIRQFVTVFFMETRHNIYANISNFSKTICENDDYIMQLNKNLLDCLIEGPRTYITDPSVKATIKSRDISQQYFAQ